MKQVIADLQTLQTLAAQSVADPDAHAQRVLALRERIPTLILGHIDSLNKRGRTGIAEVRNGVCTGCHLGLPSGLLAGIAREGELHRCDNCGRYLYLAQVLAGSPASVAAFFTQGSVSPTTPKASPDRRRRRNAADTK